ncbi:hypothetical protein ThrDRAFT_02827 [Frankia casuarinae]|uniref:Transcriptional regulator, XRE family n=2 Tax=Frankiaceae TaxID=74712 RepID=Q2J7S7_FRACC|nr:transcriptional regulator, XRE family [Frankia casuarinae]EYT91492.1 hypothetical protein ThrDRAFT_02827 [Frankia casuarinae]KDA41219.1 hypothetical protein BMG523Draft_03953 [Frankia sp. BMG5.23]
MLEAERQRNDTLDELVALLQQLIKKSGTNRTRLAERTGFPRQQVSRAVNGREVPSPDLADAFDVVFGCNGRIRHLRDEAHREKRARRLGAEPPRRDKAQPSPQSSVPKEGQELGLQATLPITPSPLPGRGPSNGPIGVGDPREARATDRRDALRAMALGTAALGPVAADLSRSIAGADPDPLSVDLAEAHIHRIAAAYRVTPHGELMDALGPEWQNIERILDRRVSPPVRARLTLIAGQYAFYLGTLAFDLGDDDTARSLLRVASQHADETKQLLPARSPRRSDVLLLDGSVAAIRSSVAYFNRAYSEAADIAAQAREGAHPFALPILAGCEARAAALAHRPDDARAALADMQEHLWDGAVMPGPNPGDAAFIHGFLAVALAHVGDGVQAEQHARVGLDLEIAANPDHYVQIGGKHNALCRAYLRRPEPDPEAAADAARHALLTVDGRPNRTVIQQAGQMWRQMDGKWPELPTVRDLGEIVQTSRRALESGPGDPASACA